VRDERYHQLLAPPNPEANQQYSLHTTGYSFDILRRYVDITHVGPGDPVERWLGELVGDPAVRVGALLNTIEQLDRESDRVLFEAIHAELTGMVQWARSPGSSGIPAPIEIASGGRFAAPPSYG